MDALALQQRFGFAREVLHQVERRRQLHRDRFRGGLAGFASDEQRNFIKLFQNDLPRLNDYAPAIAKRLQSPRLLCGARAADGAGDFFGQSKRHAANFFAGGRVARDDFRARDFGWNALRHWR